MRRWKCSLAVSVALLLGGCATTPQVSPQDAFFATLKQWCGRSFSGTTLFPDDPKHDFAGKKLTVTIESCSDTQIRMPFQVGDDRSRTWVLTKLPQGLLFKHDHRHADGRPDEVTDYGGWARTDGTAVVQNFPADEATRKLIPEAATNVWRFTLNPQTNELEYSLERHHLPRYRGVFRPLPNKSQ